MFVQCGCICVMAHHHHCLCGDISSLAVFFLSIRFITLITAFQTFFVRRLPLSAVLLILYYKCLDDIHFILAKPNHQLFFYKEDI